MYYVYVHVYMYAYMITCCMYLVPRQVQDKVSQILRILLFEQVANNFPE